MATGFLGLFYLKFLPVVFLSGGDPLMPKTISTCRGVAFTSTMISLWEGARA